MRRKQRHSLLSTLLILGFVIPGLMGIFAVQAKAIEDQSLNTKLFLQAGSTDTPTSTTIPPLSLTSTGSPIPNPLSSTGLGAVNLYAFIEAPSKPVARPYVTLIAFASVPRTGSVVIRGFINSEEFLCTESPCGIHLQSSARLVFRAYAATGETSDDVIASVSVTQVLSGYLVSIDSISQYTSFVDSCSLIWGMRDENNATWDNFVQYPYQINTNKTLHTLAARLILNGVVDASSCPAGGISLGLDWPTACGLEKAADAVTAWQNQFDSYIWLASRDQGIPPKILKTLFDYESQFWPGNSRFYIDEVGLGQINQLGVDVLLRRDPAYYQRVCPSVLSDCTRPYTSLEPSQQAQIRGAVVNSVDAACPTCKNGVDLDKAKLSVGLTASLLKANCQQVYDIVKQAYQTVPVSGASGQCVDGTYTSAQTEQGACSHHKGVAVWWGPAADAAATATKVAATIAASGASPAATNYEDMWRFTLASYHSGISCLNDAVLTAKKGGLPVNWANVSELFTCKGARDYVNGYMDNLINFDKNLYQPSDLLSVIAGPTIVPTQTAVPTPTVYVSDAKIIVKVYIDRNGNNTPDDGEWIDAMSVQVSISNSKQLTQRTVNGVTTFDMSGYAPGSGIDVSLPGLYRNNTFLLPDHGDVTVVFKFDQPALPTSLP